MTQMQAAFNPALAEALQELQGVWRDPLTAIWSYSYAVNFTNVAQNAQQAQSARVDSGTDFLVEAIQFSANFNAATTPTGAAPRAKFYRNAESAIANLTSAHYGHLFIHIQTADRPWSNIPIRCDLFTGEPGNLLLLPTKIYVSGNDTILATLFNQVPPLIGAATPAVDAQIQFLGRKMATVVRQLSPAAQFALRA